MPFEYYLLFIIIFLIIVLIILLKYLIYYEEVSFSVFQKNLIKDEERPIINKTINNVIDNECIICYEKMEYGIIRTPCNHYFHTECLNKWLESNKRDNKNCPICRINLNLN